MSLKSKAEILIYFQYLRNIDLFKQGIYQFRCSITNTQEQLQAQPYALLDLFQKGDALKYKIIRESIKPAYIDDHYFYSSAHIIQYEEERVQLIDGCLFKYEFDSLSDNKDLSILVEMMFFDLKKQHLINNDVQIFDIKQQSLNSMQECVAQVRIKVSDVLQFNQHYIPIEFDSKHVCQLKTIVTTIPLDIQYVKIDSEDNFNLFITRYSNDNLEVMDQLSMLTMHYLEDAYNHFFIKYLSIMKDHSPMEEDSMFVSQEIQTKFDDTLSEEDNKPLSYVILKSIFETSQKFYLLWFKFIDNFYKFENEMINSLEQDYSMLQKQLWSQYIISTTTYEEDLANFKDPNVFNFHYIFKLIETQAECMKRIRKDPPERIQCEVENYYCKQESQPILLRDIQIKFESQLISDGKKGLHLFVFVHGYKGGNQDLRMWKNALKLRYSKQKVMTFTPQCNIGLKSDDDIALAGQRLAYDLIKWMKDENPHVGIKRISFIAHSMGGLVVRTALPHLDRYKDLMYTFITLGTPHLGYLVKTKGLVNSGFWIIRRYQKSTSLIQLCLEDALKPEDSFIFKLSFYPGLNWFRNLVFISASRDEYVPGDVSRVQRTKILVPTSDLGRLYNQMINNMLKGLITDRIHRIQVDFRIPTKQQIITSDRTWESMIGRAAHLELIENYDFIRMMIQSFDEYFE